MADKVRIQAHIYVHVFQDFNLFFLFIDFSVDLNNLTESTKLFVCCITGCTLTYCIACQIVESVLSCIRMIFEMIIVKQLEKSFLYIYNGSV